MVWKKSKTINWLISLVFLFFTSTNAREESASLVGIHKKCQDDPKLIEELMDFVDGYEYLDFVGIMLSNLSQETIEANIQARPKRWIRSDRLVDCIDDISVDHQIQHQGLGFENIMSINDTSDMSNKNFTTDAERRNLAVSGENNYNLWHADRVNQRVLPLDNDVKPNVSSTNPIHIYIIDSGIDRFHEWLVDRCASGDDQHFVGLSSDDDNCGFFACDGAGHGTHVAGSYSAKNVGYLPNGILHSVKVLPASGSANVGTVVRGINWTIGHAKSQSKTVVVNLSVAAGLNSLLNSATQKLVSAGFLVAVAAGNNDKDACEVSPASVSGALTVGASGRDDKRASFSNHGKCVDIYAPGTHIWSTIPNNSLGTSSGTSMAAPVTGAVLSGWMAADSKLGSAGETVAVAKCVATPGIVEDSQGGTDTLVYDGYELGKGTEDCIEAGWGIKTIGVVIICSLVVIVAALCAFRYISKWRNKRRSDNDVKVVEIHHSPISGTEDETKKVGGI